MASGLGAVEMIRVSVIYGSALALLGCWATFTTATTLASSGGWKKNRTLVVLGVVFVASCFLPGVAMLTGAFRAWMLIPLGLCYIALIPMPCYFRWANDGRIRTARTILFLMVGGALVAAGLDVLPVSWFGL
jgi:hypothetical protein